MAISLGLGSETPGNQDGYLRALPPARKFCRAFENEMGSLTCKGVQQKLFGRSYDLAKPEELALFVSSGDALHCHNVAGIAAKIAAGLIIDNG
jgi:hypothetical protein